MSEFACRKHGYHDETKTHSCPDCYADWLAAKPKAPPYTKAEEQTFICGDFCCIRNYDFSHHARCPGPGKVFGVDPADPFGPRDADGWYEWKGGTGFRPAGKVDYVCREYDGYDYTDADAQYLRWEHENESDDIVKWRPAQ